MPRCCLFFSDFSKAKAYSQKAESRWWPNADPWEFGDDSDIPIDGMGTRTDLLTIKRKLETGTSLKEISNDEEHFTSWCRNHRALKIYKSMVSEPRDHPTTCITLYGETGVGKTRWVNQEYPNFYHVPCKKGSGMYYDGYEDDETVFFDEMYGNRMSHGDLLQICDSYTEHTVSVHGSANVNWRPFTIIFCSNSHPREWYNEQFHPWEGGPLQRRLAVDNNSRIYRVTAMMQLHLEEGTEPFVGPLQLI